jgi:hypothetical protein
MTSYDDDDVKAMENRLRTNGWASPPEPFFKASRVRPAAKSLMPLEDKIKSTARWLAQEFRGGSWPIYQWVADETGLSYDNAVRAVAEAKRLAGEPR